MQVGKFLEASDTDTEMAKWADHPFEFSDKYNLVSGPATQEEEKSLEAESGIKAPAVSVDEEEKKSDSEDDQGEVHEQSMQVSKPFPMFEDIGIQAFESKKKSMMPVFVDQAIGTDEVEEEEKAAPFVPKVTEDAACQYSEMPSVHVTFEEPPEEVKAPAKSKKAPKNSRKKPSKKLQQAPIESKSSEGEEWPEYNPADFEESKATKMQTRRSRNSSASAEKENKPQPQKKSRKAPAKKPAAASKSRSRSRPKAPQVPAKEPAKPKTRKVLKIVRDEEEAKEEQKQEEDPEA